MTSKAFPNGNDHIVAKGDPYYTNEDVALLHQLVTTAEQLLPTLPERERVATYVLFKAYFEILPSLGIDIDHDSRYARVLFKIGGLQGPASLYARFEIILAKMGIEIQLDDDYHEGEEAHNSGFATNSQVIFHNSIRSASHLPQSRVEGAQRRNSESTLWDFAPGSGQRALRPRSQSLLRQPNQPSSVRQSLHNQRGAPTEGVVPQIEEGRDIGAWLSTAVVGARPPSSIAVSDSLRSFRINRPTSRRARTHPGKNPTLTSQYDADGFLIGGHPTESSEFYDPPSSDLDDDDQFTEDNFSYDNDFDIPAREDQPQEVASLMLPPSATVLDIKANLIQEQHTSTHARAILASWRLQTRQIQLDYARFAAIAVEKDYGILLRSALDVWRGRVQISAAQKQTDLFFEYQGDKASRARDVYLLQNSFTKWTQDASEEVEFTDLARQHLLTSKIFRVWRETTAVNELKVRRHIMKKFFGAWRQCFDRHIDDEQKAVVVYEQNLVQSRYWAWFWAFCEQTLPAFNAIKIERRVLAKWSSLLQEHHSREEEATAHHAFTMKANPFRKWQQKTQVCLRQQGTAHHHHVSVVQLKELVKWNREATLLPVKSRVQNMIAVRAKSDALSLWRLRASQEYQAMARDRRNMLQETWTKWTDKVRIQNIEARINGRVLRQALYSWVVQERANFVKRSVEEKLQLRVLRTVQNRAVIEADFEALDNQLAQDVLESKTKARALRHLDLTLKAYKQHEAQALQIYAPNIASKVIGKWSASSKHCKEMDCWAMDGSFYFVAKRTIKNWRAATVQSQKERRREAFVQIRRNIKVKLASSVLSAWRARTRNAVDGKELRRQHDAKLAIEVLSSWRTMTASIRKSIVQAGATLQKRTITVGMEVFDKWRTQQAALNTLDTIHLHSVLTKHLLKWKNTTISMRDLQIEALSFSEDRISTSTLKKWRVTTLQLKGVQTGRDFVASGHLDNVQKRNIKRILTYWRQRTPISKPATQMQSEASGSTTINAQSRGWSETAKVESWSEFGDDAELDVEEWAREFSEPKEGEGLIIDTPIPGYLATPSRKMRGRAGVVGRGSTTPAGGLSTPFERMLRQQYGGGGAIASFRRTQGFQRDGGAGFADLGKSI